jgi:polyhydroxyalkanoate synthesis regulator phasin
MTTEQRTEIVAALVAAMVKRGEIFEDQMLQLRDELMASSDEELLEAAEELGVEKFRDSRGVGL